MHTLYEEILTSLAIVYGGLYKYLLGAVESEEME